MQGETIGEWTITELTKFIQNSLEEFNNAQLTNKIYEILEIKRKLIIDDEIQFAQPINTVGAAGSASALPANPASYVKVIDPLGNVRQIPLYNIA